MAYDEWKSDGTEQTILWGDTETTEAQPVVDASDPCLIQLHPPGANLGRRVVLDRARYVFGRDADVDIVLNTNTVSRRHAEIVKDEQGLWWLEDLSSTNGTFVNERRIDRERIGDGVRIRLGEIILKFLIEGDIETAYHEEIYRMTIVDGLTGFHNKRYFLEFLEREIAQSARHGHPLSLLMMDIDHFKRINDERGHLAGDAVLKAIAGRIGPRIRREELFARYGGEEFAVILSVTDLEGGIRFAEQLRGLVADRPFSYEGESFTVTTSIGVATLFDQPDMTTDALIAQADKNLYEAKDAGRNRVHPMVKEPLPPRKKLAGCS
ncbi:MAG: GGDEF domain-containing protein [Gammaproteobacteria bacterium]|nr:GGDEF domain-containing protein [Gammaproteobacteria bacterium]MDH3468054.1 GGDEF domain-containing protein [Gammaproteobacteria bacterium]